MRISDWSSDVCSSDLGIGRKDVPQRPQPHMTAKGHEFVTAEQIETLQRRPVAAMVLDIARYIFSEVLFGEKDLRMNVAPILLRAFHIISVGRLSRQDQCSGRPRQIDPHMYLDRKSTRLNSRH